MHGLRGLDLVLRDERARQQLEDVEPALDLGADDRAVVPIDGPRAGCDETSRIERAAIEVRDFLRMRDVGPVEDRDAALIPTLHHDFTARNWNERSIMGHAV